ncbi:hypothetical protein ABPG73_016938, partial [Tetrahymena malaccensis]
MKKFILLLALIYICQAANQGIAVVCSYIQSDCQVCGATKTIQNFFAQYQQGSVCYVKDCSSAVIGNNLNGLVCNSCSTATGDGNIAQGQYFDGTNCVQSCPIGQKASESNQYICQYPDNQGSLVSCSTDSSSCSGCGKGLQKYDPFIYASSTNCYVQNCNAAALSGNLNGWVCNSCSTATGTGNINKGQFFDGTNCVDSCPNGQVANAQNGYICQTPVNPGGNVSCSTDSTSCNGCGSTTAIQNLFSHVTNSNCQVKDCSSTTFGSNLNGWVCNSCSTATGSGNINKGQFFDGTNCVDSCPNGKIANQSTGYECKPAQVDVAVQGNPVSCSSDQSTCSGCGENITIQALFKYNGQANCFIQDCSSASAVSNLNGWVCSSCDQVKGSKVLPGKYFDGNTCTSTCSTANQGIRVVCSKNGQNCQPCGATPTIQNLFTKFSGAICYVQDCSSAVIGNNLNGFVCNSCNTASGDGNIVKGQYFDGTNCVQSCPIGSTASESSQFICQYPDNQGSLVSCSTDSSSCSGCKQGLKTQDPFIYASSTNCYVSKCTTANLSSNLNGWICKSCSTATGTGNINKGQFFDGTNCVDSCPNGQVANAQNGYVCQTIANPGGNVSCSTDSSNCNGCGSTTPIQNLFSHVNNSNCQVKDCSSTAVGSNLNGWVCNSCSTATGSGNINKGQFFDGTNCVDSCPNDKIANQSTGYECKPAQVDVAVQGNPVSCSSDQSTCSGCGENITIQALFKYNGQANCFIQDCSSPSAINNLNSWVCSSCDQVKGSKVPPGKYFDGNTCTSTCSKVRTHLSYLNQEKKNILIQ